MRPRLAVLLGGRVAVSSESARSVARHLAAYKERFDVSYFVSVNSSVHDEGYTRALCSALGIPDECVRVEATEVPAAVLSFPRRPETNAANTFSMFHHNKQCMLMAADYSSARGIDFDIVMKYRADISAGTTVPFVDGPKDNTVYVPEGNDWIGGLNDQVAYGTPEAMTKYCGAVDHVVALCSLGVLYHPETLLRACVQFVSGMAIERFPFEYAILR